MINWEKSEKRCKFCRKLVANIGQHLFISHREQWRIFKSELKDIDDEIYRLSYAEFDHGRQRH